MRVPKGLKAGVLEVLQLPFAPLVEFARAFDNIRWRDAIAVGIGTSVDRLVYRYMEQRGELYRQREQVIDQVKLEGNSPKAVRLFREMEVKFLELGTAYSSRAIGCGSLPLEILADSKVSATEMGSIARDLDGALLRTQASVRPPSGPAPAPPVTDPRLLAALDRLGFTLADLPRLSPRAIGDRFRERALQFHPDTKSPKDKGFYEDQMQRLNEAKDLLSGYLGGGERCQC